MFKLPAVNMPNIDDANVECKNSSDKKELTNSKRRAVLQALLERSKARILKRGAIKDVAATFGIGRNTVGKIWSRALESSSDMSVPMDVSSSKFLCGRKKKDYSSQLGKISTITLRRRSTLRSTAEACGIPKTTLIARMKDGEIRRHSNAIKPFLTVENKKSRVEFCRSNFDLNRRNFKEMFDVVYIDEIWFYMTQNARKFYLGKDESDPLRTTQSKRFITKVMFLAEARPRWDPHRKCYFGGKIGIWPFVTKEVAKRNSRNRPAGKMMTKVMDSITKVQMRDFLVEKVLVSIREKWPTGSIAQQIKIQQYNAQRHLHPTDPLFKEESERLGLNIELFNQPPNSPDLNVLDLGYFNAIQSIQHKKAPMNVVDLIQAVEDSFQALQRSKLNNIFLTLQQTMEQTIFADSSNNYRVQHLQKHS